MPPLVLQRTAAWSMVMGRAEGVKTARQSFTHGFR